MPKDNKFSCICGYSYITIINGRHTSAGSVKTVTFENFSVNGFSMTGTKTITNMWRKDNGNMYWKIEVNNAIITSPEGRTFSWNSVRERERVAGEGTPHFLRDDIFHITGVTTGINRQGKAFSRTIILPLVLKMNCKFIVQGSVELKVEERRDAVLDYGDGTCDDIATITVNGETRNIRLGR